MSQDNVLAALKPFADAWDEYVRDGGPDGKASAEILLRPDSEFIAASNAVRDVEDIRIKEPISPEAQIRALEGALTNAKIDLRMAKARECRMQTAIRWALGELGGFPGRSEGQGAYWWRTELRERAALADSQPCKHAAELADLKTERDDLQTSFDLRWKADMRAIKAWQTAHPGNDLVWPDHVDLCLWLMEQLNKATGGKS